MLLYNIQHFGNWSWLPWLVRVLAHPANQILLTYDGSEQDVNQIGTALSQAMPLLKRLDVERSLPIRWCGPSQAAMQIEALRRALWRNDWEFFINLSGTCTPLQSQTAIRERLMHFHAAGYTVFLSAFQCRRSVTLPHETPGALIETRQLRRLTLRGNTGLLDQFNDPGFFPVTNPANRPYIMCAEPEDDSRVLAVAAPDDAELSFRQAYFNSIPHYCGRAWYILHRSACEKLVEFFDSERSADTLTAFLASFEPDESLLPTVIMNELCVPLDKIWNENFRAFQGAPRRLDNETYETLLAKTEVKAMFARKVHHEMARSLRTHVEQIVSE